MVFIWIKTILVRATFLHLFNNILTLLILLLQFHPILDCHLELFKYQIVSHPVSSWVIGNKIIFVCVVFLDSSVQGYTDPILRDVLPIVRHPQDSTKTQSQLEISTNVVIIQRFIEPISIPKCDTTHINIICWWKIKVDKLDKAIDSIRTPGFLYSWIC